MTTNEEDVPQERFKPTVENMNTVRKKPVATLHLAFAAFFLLAIIGNAVLWAVGGVAGQITSYFIAIGLAAFMVGGLIFANWVSEGKLHTQVNVAIGAQAAVVLAAFLFLISPEAGLAGFIVQTLCLGFASVITIVAGALIAFRPEAPVEELEEA